jgi:hypothetical protein
MTVETVAAILYHILKYSPIHDKILVQAEIQVFWDVTLRQLVNSADRADHHTSFIFRPRPSKGSALFLDFFTLKPMAQ